MSFIIGDLITTKKEFDANYAATTSDAICEVVEVEEGRYSLKMVRHSKDKVLVGEIYKLPSELIEEFEKISEDLEAELKDEINILSGWRSGKEYAIDSKIDTYEMYRKALDYISSYGHISDSSIYKESRLPLFVVEEPFSSSKRVREYSIGCNALDFSGVKPADALKKLKNQSYNSSDLLETFVKIPTAEMEKITEEIIKDGTFKEEEFPKELLLTCFSRPHIIRVFRRENLYVYATNVFTDEVITRTAAYILPIRNKVAATMDTITALIESNKEKLFVSLYLYAERLSEYIKTALKVEMIEKMSKEYCGFNMKNIQKTIDTVSSEADRLERDVQLLLDRKKSLQMKKFYFDAGKANESEFGDFIKANNSAIVSCRMNGNRMDFCVKTFMTYWEDSDYLTIRDGNYATFNEKSDAIKTLLDEVLMKKTVKLQFEQRFSLYLTEGDSYTPQCNKDSYDTSLGEGYVGFPNPHIHGHNCWGDYTSMIKKANRDGDLIQAYSLCVAACSGVNLFDSPVFGKFMNYLNNYKNGSCLHLQDGRVISIAQYEKEYVAAGNVKWVKEEPKKETKEKSK